MRKVNRKKISVPWALQSEEARLRRLELRRYYALPQSIRAHRRAPFKDDILTADEVVSALNAAFFSKCAYCETQLSRKDANVAHYRPMNAALDRSDSASVDHYGWFAYEWQNLLLICPRCQTAKRNLFPVEGPRAPLLSTWQEAQNAEAAELLDPSVDNPMHHLLLCGDGRLQSKSRRGWVTIETVDLNRADLVAQRFRLILLLANEITAGVDLFRKQGVEAGLDAQFFASHLHDEAEFAGIARLFYRAVYECLPKYYRPRRFPTSDFQRSIPQLLLTIQTEALQEAQAAFLAMEDLDRRVESISYHAAPEWDLVLANEREASRYITSISINYFKGFDQIDIRLAEPRSGFQAPCAILLGENATGKSSILQAICLALMDRRQRERLKTGADLYVSRERSSWHMVGDREASVLVRFDDGTETRLGIYDERFVGDGEPCLIVLAYGARRIFKVGYAENRSSAALNRTLFDPFAIIADSTRWLQTCTDSEFAAVARAMNEVLVLQVDDHIYRDGDGNILVRAHGRNTPIQRMSDGYKSLFAMTIDIMRRMVERWGNLEEARGIVLIDEIETHLHPRWKMQVMTALRRSMPLVQFIATTHDPLCLRGMVDGEVHVLSRTEDNRIVELADLPSVQGLRNEQLLTSDYFGLSSTADPEFERLLGKYSAALATGNRRDVDRELIAKLGDQISDMTIIGDTPAQQIVSEALARYLATPRTSVHTRREFREDAVQAVLDALDSVFNEKNNETRR